MNKNFVKSVAAGIFGLTLATSCNHFAKKDSANCGAKNGCASKTKKECNKCSSKKEKAECNKCSTTKKEVKKEVKKSPSKTTETTTSTTTTTKK